MILVVLLVLGGCTSRVQEIEDQGVKDRERITAQYVAGVDLRQAADAIFPQGYTLEEQPRLPLNCSNGGVLYGVSYIVGNIDASKNDSYFDLMMEYWSFMGWNLQNNNRPDAMFMNATKKVGDGTYLMSIRGGIHGQVAIGNSTPCI